MATREREKLEDVIGGEAGEWQTVDGRATLKEDPRIAIKEEAAGANAVVVSFIGEGEHDPVEHFGCRSAVEARRILARVKERAKAVDTRR